MSVVSDKLSQTAGNARTKDQLAQWMLSRNKRRGQRKPVPGALCANCTSHIPAQVVCAKCGVIAYCSRWCRNSNREEHQQTCTVITQIARKKRSAVVTTRKRFEPFRESWIGKLVTTNFCTVPGWASRVDVMKMEIQGDYTVRHFMFCPGAKMLKGSNARYWTLALIHVRDGGCYSYFSDHTAGVARRFPHYSVSPHNLLLLPSESSGDIMPETAMECKHSKNPQYSVLSWETGNLLGNICLVKRPPFYCLKGEPGDAAALGHFLVQVFG